MHQQVLQASPETPAHKKRAVEDIAMAWSGKLARKHYILISARSKIQLGIRGSEWESGNE
jgi:hypothetical protein